MWLTGLKGSEGQELEISSLQAVLRGSCLSSLEAPKRLVSWQFDLLVLKMP